MELYAVTTYKTVLGKTLFQLTNLKTGAALIMGTYEKSMEFLENFIPDGDIKNDMIFELKLARLSQEIQNMEIY